MGRKGGRIFRNSYKGRMDKTKGGWVQRREMGMGGVGGKWWGENENNCT